MVRYFVTYDDASNFFYLSREDSRVPYDLYTNKPVFFESIEEARGAIDHYFSGNKRK